MNIHTLSSSWALSHEDRAAYLKAMQRDAQRYGPDGRTLIGSTRRDTATGLMMRMTREGWQHP